MPCCSPISCSSERHRSNASCASLFFLVPKAATLLLVHTGRDSIHHHHRSRGGQQFSIIFGILLLLILFTCGSIFDLYLYNFWSTSSNINSCKISSFRFCSTIVCAPPCFCNISFRLTSAFCYQFENKCLRH